nr:uncharacterized mitochondrial protein AtMg00810-like [Tanacetum cinerariifolium]
MCARYQANPNEHHVSAVKRIFRYLKQTISLGLWYPKDSGFDLTAYSDIDHAGCHLDRKSTSGSVQFLGDKLVCWSSKKQNWTSPRLPFVYDTVIMNSRLCIELLVSGQQGYWASLRIEPDLISRIKEAQKEDSEIWTIVENLDKQVEFRIDDDNVLWQDTRLVVPNDVSLREALLTEAHSSPFLVHPGSTKMYHELKQYFWWSGMKRDVATLDIPV